MNEYVESNRSLWDGWTRLHAHSEFYDLEGFKAGRSSLKPVELAEVGDVRGRSLLHLQCHFGQDTLSWARLGARVTGVDFSDEAISLARALSEELHIPARFIRSDIYDLPSALRDRFDIVFTSYGVLSWLPDLDRWAEIAAHFLKAGGFFYIVDAHPIFGMVNFEGTALEYGYFHSSEPVELESHGSYASGDAEGFSHPEYNWEHSLSDVVNAVIGAGLRLEFLHEFPYIWYIPSYVSLEEFEPGKGRLKGHLGMLPHMFSLRAAREPQEE
ncbi:MAG TPA: methyltransferase domain-containing protein [Pyrinomonadaceae bacterium]|nr:methyltransferase domain-containing protein [Pyrinomonadaceae bacterium]